MSGQVCDSCIDEMCFICISPREDETCCCQGTFGRLSFFGELANQADTAKRGPGRPKMVGGDMRNPVQAGRARAEDIAPLSESYVCDWAMLMYAGGGVEPIVGCEGNVATDRHHGPDKSTLNNDVGVNLHRVCPICHNRWHYRNDKYYATERPEDNGPYLPLAEHGTWQPHDRFTQASPQHIIASNTWWSLPVKGRAPYRNWEGNNDTAAKQRPALLT